MAKKGDLVARYAVTAGGTAVMETVFPGTQHEMVTVYHADGPDIVLQHFCMEGNQPRMRAKAPAAARVEFAFDGGLEHRPREEPPHAPGVDGVSRKGRAAYGMDGDRGRQARAGRRVEPRPQDQLRRRKAPTMKYLLLIYENEAVAAGMAEADQGKIWNEYMEYTDDIKAKGQHIAGEALQPVATATTVRVKDGKTVSTDGPFAETREQLGGFYMVEAKDLDEAIALAARIPASRTGSVEVRPILPTMCSGRPDRPGLLSSGRSMDIETVFREERARALATLIRLLGDFDLAEESLQDAFAAALVQWPREGQPQNPRAWLVSTARHRGIDRIRRQRRFAPTPAEDLLAASATEPDMDREPDPFPDDRLRLIFTCCHPALALEAQIALTLKTLGGLAVEEIARAFLVAPATMAQRLVRAKNKIRAARIPYEVPSPERLGERLDGVLRVLYLLFTEGYAPTSGGGQVRADLCAEAIRLARLLTALLPAEAEASALLGLLLLQDSRQETRFDAAGRPGDARRAGPHALGRGAHRRRRRARGGRAPPRRGRLLRDPGGHRGPARAGRARGGHRLAADRDPLRRPAAAAPVAGRRAEPRGRRRDGGRAGAGPAPPRGDRVGRRARRLPPAAGGQGGPAAAPGPARGGRGRVRRRAGPHAERRRAALPRAAAAGGRMNESRA